MPALTFHVVDAFTRTAFRGNPAAVMIFSDTEEDEKLSKDDELMQNIAAEHNYAETAFARKLKGGSEEEPLYELRWRTPEVEVKLCGHATLATAHILFSTSHSSAKAILFRSLHSGDLRAVRDASTGLITLDFPAVSILTLESGHRRKPKIVEAILKTTKLEESKLLRVGYTEFFGGSVIVEIDTSVDLKGLSVDTEGLRDNQLTILTQAAPADSGFDVYSRVFAPAVGINEDPVTGAAHTIIAPFWLTGDSTARLSTPKAHLEASTLKCSQVSKRGGEIDVVWNKEGKRVELRGYAKTVMKGEVFLE